METTLSSKRVTIRDVALAAGVDKATVSYALSGKRQVTEKTREAVLKAARELGYRPNPHAQRLSNGGCTKTIGLFSLGLDLGVATSKIQIIQRLLSQQGFDVPLYAYGAYGGGEHVNQVELMRTLCMQGPRAIVCITTGLQAEAMQELQNYMEQGNLVVCFDLPTSLPCDHVIFDREDNTYQAARHLLELGHRDLGYYAHGPHRVHDVRRNGFCRALQEWEVPVNQQWLFSGGLYGEGGIQLARQFLQLASRPSGLCITNETVAAMFIHEIQNAGLRVPQDVSVVSHDDLPIAQCCAVPLTTVTHPVEEIASHVVNMVSSRLHGEYEGAPRETVVRGSLVQRQSAIALTQE
jgi:DNA-binding LacI/PurR family transcriptional regulator